VNLNFATPIARWTHNRSRKSPPVQESQALCDFTGRLHPVDDIPGGAAQSTLVELGTRAVGGVQRVDFPVLADFAGTVVCPTCNGSGKVQVHQGYGYEIEDDYCPSCDGEGRVSASRC